MQEQFVRTALLLGADGVDKLAEKKVVVMGVGGVGSFAVEALARSGVGHLVLVDNDIIDVSNINRQLPATLETVGRYKTHVIKEHLKTINPNAIIETQEIFVLPDNINSVIPKDVDYIIDALDTVATKISIVEYCHKNGIPMISCMSAGNKLDPTAFRVADLYDTEFCPLCRVMRQELRKREVDRLKVVYSPEAPISPKYNQLPEDMRKEIVGDGDIRDIRTIPPGSVSFVPSVAGMIAGGEAIKDMLGIRVF